MDGAGFGWSRFRTRNMPADPKRAISAATDRNDGHQSASTWTSRPLARCVCTWSSGRYARLIGPWNHGTKQALACPSARHCVSCESMAEARSALGVRGSCGYAPTDLGHPPSQHDRRITDARRRPWGSNGVATAVRQGTGGLFHRRGPYRPAISMDMFSNLRTHLRAGWGLAHMAEPPYSLARRRLIEWLMQAARW